MSCAPTLQTSDILGKGTVIESLKRPYRSNVSIVDKKGNISGAGVIIYNGKNKYMTILSAAHVIVSMQKKKKDIYIQTFYDAPKRKVVPIKMDTNKDLVLLQAIQKEKKDGPYAELARTFPLIGERVWVIGAPLGDEGTAVWGVLSNVTNKNKNRTLYKTSAPIFFGNSGGGMYNVKGELIGILHAKQFAKIGFFLIPVAGGGYAISLPTIRKFL